MNEKRIDGDERLRKTSGESVRGGRANADEDRVENNGTAFSAAERRQALRQNWVQEVLPTVPEIPGFHTCWLSTTNATDPVYKRIQHGYLPVQVKEVPGFSQFTVTGGEFDGCVACNEMLLFKIPNEIYQDLMTIFHHDMPMEQEQNIYDAVTGNVEYDKNGNPLTKVEGFQNLARGQGPRKPQFS